MSDRAEEMDVELALADVLFLVDKSEELANNNKLNGSALFGSLLEK